MSVRRRAIVCGTSFGRFYLHALAQHPAVELAGVLSTGSRASAEYAGQYGIAHYTALSELPPDIDFACVVVRAGVSGGPGADISETLLTRGIHVLQEHPLHPAELARCLRSAHRHGVRYSVNAFYPTVAPIARFLQAAELLRRHGAPLFVDGICGAQVLYPLLDVAARAVGRLRPSVLRPFVPARCGPYTSLHGEIGGVPCTLRVQNQIHPVDADNHALLLHRLTLGFESGILALADTHGPVIWSPRLHTHRDATHRLVLSGPGTERLSLPSSEMLAGTESGTFRDVFDRLWPQAINLAMSEFIATWGDPAAAARSAQWASGVTAFWHEVSTALGSPDLIYPEAPPPVNLADLLPGIGENR
ncbi:Gfo/Idh/MocA family oxidoreductase [Bradyrhizobium sp. 2S1]|uniref:Gfo/Idh/MocA family oxidoreductase n=1 Tax=Bradyrhizobium sp. 2S1 TaxID=1404429 RepID=UPI00140D5C50|nr:Gfo/Idh/MocA family oxidoreductase [Bradyrhizobium sp. 2S1]MCK7673400.1 Gfo/Idh/MocA family oxidoreductase [Bradyrhizobium sp. 2S1]